MRERFKPILYDSLILTAVAFLVYAFLTTYEEIKIRKLKQSISALNSEYLANVDSIFKNISEKPETAPITEKKYKETVIATAPAVDTKSYKYLNAFSQGQILTTWNDLVIPIERSIEERNKDETINNLILLMIQNLNNKIDSIGKNMISKWDIFIVMAEIIGVLASICVIITFVIYVTKKKKEKA